jgi:hypothetical protein
MGLIRTLRLAVPNQQYPDKSVQRAENPFINSETKSADKGVWRWCAHA